MNIKQLQGKKGNTLCYPKVTKHVTEKRGFYYQKCSFVTLCYRLLPLKTAVFTIKNAVFNIFIHNGLGNITPFRHRNAKNAVFCLSLNFGTRVLQTIVGCNHTCLIPFSDKRTSAYAFNYAAMQDMGIVLEKHEAEKPKSDLQTALAIAGEKNDDTPF